MDVLRNRQYASGAAPIAHETVTHSKPYQISGVCGAAILSFSIACPVWRWQSAEASPRERWPSAWPPSSLQHRLASFPGLPTLSVPPDIRGRTPPSVICGMGMRTDLLPADNPSRRHRGPKGSRRGNDAKSAQLTGIQKCRPITAMASRMRSDGRALPLPPAT